MTEETTIIGSRPNMFDVAGQLDACGRAHEKSYTKNGMCIRCKKIRTHKKSYSFSKRKTIYRPLTVLGEVEEGRCLRCKAAVSSVDAATILKERQPRSRIRQRRVTVIPSQEARNDNDKLEEDDDRAIGMIKEIDCIVEAMNEHRQNLEVQEEGCRLIRSYSGGFSNDEDHLDVDACSNASALGGTFAVLSAMDAHRHSQSVQENGLCVLKNMLRASSDNRRSIVQNGGIEVIVRAMNEMSNRSSTIQEDGCIVLWSLAFEDRIVQRLIAQCDGVPAVLTSMLLCMESETVLRNGCGLLHTLSSNEDVARSIFACAGLDVILSALQKHTKCRELTRYALGTLVNLSAHAEHDCQRRFSEMTHEEVGLLSVFLENDVACPTVHASGCYLLQKISDSKM